MSEFANPPSEAQSLLLPTWISPEQKVMYLKQQQYHKGFLEFQEGVWRFSCRRRNGTEKWGEKITHLNRNFQTLVDQAILIPGWQKAQHYQGRASHVSAAGLQYGSPRSLKASLEKDYADRQIWLDSYHEEYSGLEEHETFAKIDERQYKALCEQHGIKAIPSMCVQTIKKDSNGKPVRAKSRIVVLGNKDPVPWSKSDCYAPVVPQHIVRLLASLAVRNKTTLKQGDCKNAFCHPILPEEEITVVKPPAGCPII